MFFDRDTFQVENTSIFPKHFRNFIAWKVFSNNKKKETYTQKETEGTHGLSLIQSFIFCVFSSFYFSIQSIGLPCRVLLSFFFSLACCLKSGADPVFFLWLYVFILMCLWFCSLNTFQWGALAFTVRTCDFCLFLSLLLVVVSIYMDVFYFSFVRFVLYHEMKSMLRL